jgi:hypothetical protein
MIVCGIVTNVLFSGVFGVRRTMDFFGLKWHQVVNWLWPSARVFIFGLTLALGLRFFTVQLPDFRGRFMAEALAMAAVAGLGLWLFGLPATLKNEFQERFQNWLRRRRGPS